MRFQQSSDLTGRRYALLSDCGRYRYALGRECLPQEDSPLLCFLMLNPSTADGLKDDPTIRRCMGYMRSWGFRKLVVKNLFAYRATDPGELLKACDPVGPGNNFQIAWTKQAALIIAAWGSKVPFARDRQVLEILAGKQLHCLGTTKHGHPRHPLYCRADLQPIPWEPPC